MTTTHPAAAPAAASGRATPSQNLVTVGLGWWLMVGIFIDGWAHNNLGESLETFFTPWHALFYSGFAAVAGWTLWLTWQGMKSGRRGVAAFPDGYWPAALGVPVFALGGVGDLLWHTIFGIEVGIEALLSPTHLLLFTGSVLILSAPLNASWRMPTPRRAPAGVVWPALMATTAILCFTSFMQMYLWGYADVPVGVFTCAAGRRLRATAGRTGRHPSHSTDPGRPGAAPAAALPAAVRGYYADVWPEYPADDPDVGARDMARARADAGAGIGAGHAAAFA
ncbi:hypothetical protein ACFFLM_13705 [Deinococcus oregonensis]|uniref:DUF998 domain-containing protein n=1 Tax=Deinococcus oregonensis TaxID=1805970 RepID=A0ABV6AZV1_9DEIO